MKLEHLQYELLVDDEGKPTNNLNSVFFKLEVMTPEKEKTLDSILSRYLSELPLTRKPIMKVTEDGEERILEEKYHGLTHSVFGVGELDYAVVERTDAANEAIVRCYFELSRGKGVTILKEIVKKLQPEMNETTAKNYKSLMEL